MRLDHWVFAKIQAFRSDEEGASAIEYALIAALIAVGIIGFGGDLTGAIETLYGKIVDALDGVGANTGG